MAREGAGVGFVVTFLVIGLVVGVTVAMVVVVVVAAGANGVDEDDGSSEGRPSS